MERLASSAVLVARGKDRVGCWGGWLESACSPAVRYAVHALPDDCSARAMPGWEPYRDEISPPRSQSLRKVRGAAIVLIEDPKLHIHLNRTFNSAISLPADDRVTRRDLAA